MTEIPKIHHRLAPAWVLYDGHCGFCRALIARFAVWWRGHRVHQAPLQHPAAQRAVSATGGTDAELQVFIGHRRHGGAAAVAALLARDPVTWPLACLLRAPGLDRLAAAGYRWVAANRHRLSAQCGLDQQP